MSETHVTSNNQLTPANTLEERVDKWLLIVISETFCLAKEAEKSDRVWNVSTKTLFSQCLHSLYAVCVAFLSSLKLLKCSPFSRFICRSCCRELSAATFRSPWMFRKSVSVDDKLVSWPPPLGRTTPALLLEAAAAANVE